jgi:hypothetical protein
VPTFEVHEGVTAIEIPPAIRTPAQANATATRPVVKREQPNGFATLLGSTSGLRDAIILREIFGPPRSLQTIEF